MAKDKGVTIVIKKVQGGKAGAHGGAWKVAYADFVTAMMAFFMVMWLLVTSTAMSLFLFTMTLLSYLSISPVAMTIIK